MFGKLFKRGISKAGLPELTPDSFNTIDVFLTVINDFTNDVEGIYRESGDAKEVKKVEAAAMAGQFTEQKLNAACNPLNPHVLTAAFKKFLLAHQPLVPTDLYDTVLSSTDLTGVLSGIPTENKDALEVFCRQVWAISRNRRPQMDLNALSVELCTAILRGPVDDGKNPSPEVKAAFSKMVTQKNDLFRASRPVPSIEDSVKARAEKKTDAAKPSSEPADNIMNRSVKITPPKGFPAVTDDEVTDILSIFGEVHQVGSKPKSKIIMFGSVKEAVKCVKDWDNDDNTLYECKIAYLGDQSLLDEPVSPPLASAPRSTDKILKSGMDSPDKVDKKPIDTKEHDSFETPCIEREVESASEHATASADASVAVKKKDDNIAATHDATDKDEKASAWPRATRSTSNDFNNYEDSSSEERAKHVAAWTDAVVMPSHSKKPRKSFEKTPEQAPSEEKKAGSEASRRMLDSSDDEDDKSEPKVEATDSVVKKMSSPSIRKLHSKVITVTSPNADEGSELPGSVNVSIQSDKEQFEALKKKEGSPLHGTRYDSKGRLMADQNPILNIPRPPERHVDDQLGRDKINDSIELPPPVPDYNAGDIHDYKERGHHARAPKQDESRWSSFISQAGGLDSTPPRPTRADVNGDSNSHRENSGALRNMPFVAGVVDKVHKKSTVAKENVRVRDAERRMDPDRIAQRLAEALLKQHEAPEPIRQYAHHPPASPYTGYPVHIDLNIMADRRHQDPSRFEELNVKNETDEPAVALRGRPVIDDSVIPGPHKIVGETKMPWPVKESEIHRPDIGAKVKQATDSIFNTTQHKDRDQVEMGVYENRLRFLEAELQARVDRSKVDDGERKRMEEAWIRELTASRIRVSEQQKELSECHDAIRQLKSDLACRDGEISALTAAKNTAEGTVHSAKSKAEREAMGTVMSQQRLITLMEEERDALQKKNKQVTAQVDELLDENKNLQIAAMEWRTKALATEQAFVAFAGERAVAKAHDDMGHVPPAPNDAENDRIHNASLPTRQMNAEARGDAFDQTKRYLDKKNGENPALSLNEKYLDRDSTERSLGNNRKVDEGSRDLVVPQKQYDYRPDNSRRLRQDLVSSRARVNEVLKYDHHAIRGANKRTSASDWAPRLHQRARFGGDFDPVSSSPYQPRTPELKNWLRGDSAPQQRNSQWGFK